MKTKVIADPVITDSLVASKILLQFIPHRNKSCGVHSKSNRFIWVCFFCFFVCLHQQQYMIFSPNFESQLGLQFCI